MATVDDLASACPDVDPAVVREFVARMDADYLARFSRDEIARHVRLSAELTADRPARIDVTRRYDGRLDLGVRFPPRIPSFWMTGRRCGHPRGDTG